MHPEQNYRSVGIDRSINEKNSEDLFKKMTEATSTSLVACRSCNWQAINRGDVARNSFYLLLELETYQFQPKIRDEQLVLLVLQK